MLFLSLAAGVSNWAFRAPREDQLVHLKCTVSSTGVPIVVLLDLTTSWSVMVLINGVIVSGPMIEDQDGNRVLHMDHNAAQLAIYVSGRAVMKLSDWTVYNLTCEDKDGLRL